LIIFGTSDKVALCINNPTLDKIILFKETFKNRTVCVVLHTFTFANGGITLQALAFVAFNLTI